MCPNNKIINCTRDADTRKSLARPTSRCILLDGENISLDASLVIYRVVRSRLTHFKFEYCAGAIACCGWREGER